MMIQVGLAMINVHIYQKVLCVKEIVQKVMTNVVTSVYPLVKCKIIIPAIQPSQHSVFLMTFLTSIGGLVMGHALQTEICVMGNARKGLTNVVTTGAFLPIKFRIIRIAMGGV